jgi:hypothetical protein
MTTKLKPSLESFVWEILQDLPRLIAEHPQGITIAHLHEEYGESTARIMRALTTLEQKQKIQVFKAVNNSHYILPLNYDPKTKHADLTELQRNLIQFIETTCASNNTNQLLTSYSQLARVLKCSAGGLQNCLMRLQKLNLIHILQPPKQGKQLTLLIGLGSDQKSVDHNLDT